MRNDTDDNKSGRIFVVVVVVVVFSHVFFMMRSFLLDRASQNPKPAPVQISSYNLRNPRRFGRGIRVASSRRLF